MLSSGNTYFSGRNPLYRLVDLKNNPSSLVWIVEGEKCADALAERGFVATASGSATSASITDWTPIKGRNVVIWPDKDDAGRKYATQVTKILLDLKCQVKLIDIDNLAQIKGASV